MIPSTPGRLFLWIISACRPWIIIKLLLCALGLAAAEIAIPWLLYKAVDTALGSGDIAQVDRFGLTMLVLVAGLYLMHSLLLRLETGILQGGLGRLRKELFSTILAQPLSFFTKTQTGHLMHRVVSDTDVLERHASYLFSDLPYESITVLGVLTAMLVIEPRLALAIICFMLVASLVASHIGQPLPTLRDRAQNAGAAFTARLEEIFNAIRTVKVFGRESDELMRLESDNQNIKTLENKTGHVEAVLIPTFYLMEIFGIVFIVWYGAHLIVQGRLTPGGLVAFIAYMELIAGPLSNAGKYHRHFMQCRAVSRRLGEFVSGLAPEIRNEGRLDIPGTAPAIAFDAIHFTYPDSKRVALDSVSLEIAAGETIAIVGSNGSGKSTLMDLLLCFHEPVRGRITVDAVDLADLDPQAWRNAVGTMSQEAVLFHASIYENIAYGLSGASQAQILCAAERAGLSDLLTRLPEGLDTMVGDRGCRLSGGERQRIALARLFLRDPKILILDEPTTHLDAKAQREVTETLSQLARGRTTFLIEHHPEVRKIASRYVMLDAGRMVGSGLLPPASDHAHSSRPVLRLPDHPASEPGFRGPAARTSNNIFTPDLHVAVPRMTQPHTEDSLTGLIGHKDFVQRLEQTLDHSRESGVEAAICHLDLDYLAVICDTTGQAGRQALLKQVAQLLMDRTRSSDALTRMGDDFCLLLENCPATQAAGIAETLVTAVRGFPFSWQSRTFTVGISVGVTSITAAAASTTLLLGQAQAACAAAKHQGGNRVHLHQTRDGTYTGYPASSLTAPLDTYQFQLYYQPIYPTASDTDKSAYYEVLLRLRDINGQDVLPADFIPTAERNGQMAAIDRWVIRTALESYQTFLAETPAKTHIAINLSAASLNDASLAAYIDEQLANFDVPRDCLCFELSEAAAVNNLLQTKRLIKEAKEIGCKFALDDFGSGLSSITNLKQLSVDYLKIDGNLVRNMLDDPGEHAMVRAINDLGHVLGVQTIAECAEGNAILAELRAMGVDYTQGYATGAPLALETLVRKIPRQGIIEK